MWKQYELEYLDNCPVCGSPGHTVRFSGIEDRTTDTPGQWSYCQCKDCGVFYMDTRPTEETIVRAYDNYFTHTLVEVRPRAGWLDQMALRIRNDYLKWRYGHDNEPALPGGRWIMYLLPPWLRLEWDHYARHLPKPMPGRNLLLDVGCGNGQFLAAALKAGWACHGVDFDPKVVETAKCLDIEVALGSLAEKQFPDDFFDAITLSHVIEHIHHPAELLKECARVLKPGGTLWVATPNADSIIRRWFQRNWLAYAPPHHLVLFNSRSIRKLIERLGLSIHFEHQGLHVQRHWRASKLLQNGKTGLSEVYLNAFSERKTMLRYCLLEMLVWLVPSFQGDLILRATKI